MAYYLLKLFLFKKLHIVGRNHGKKKKNKRANSVQRQKVNTLNKNLNLSAEPAQIISKKLKYDRLIQQRIFNEKSIIKPSERLKNKSSLIY